MIRSTTSSSSRRAVSDDFCSAAVAATEGLGGDDDDPGRHLVDVHGVQVVEVRVAPVHADLRCRFSLASADRLAQPTLRRLRRVRAARPRPLCRCKPRCLRLQLRNLSEED